MEKRHLIALILVFAMLFVFQMFFTSKEQPVKEGPKKKQSSQEVEKPAKAADTTAPAKAGATKAEAVKAEAVKAGEPKVAKKDVVVETPLYTATFTDLGGGLKSFVLKKYKESVDGKKGKELIENIKPYAYIPKVVKTSGNAEFDDKSNLVPDKDSLKITDKKETLVFSGTMTDGKKIRKTYTFSPETYTIDVKIDTEVSGAEKLSADFAFLGPKEGSSYNFRGSFLFNGKKFEQIEKVDKATDYGTNYLWAGFDEGYFAFIWIPPTDATPPLTLGKTDTGIPRLRITPGQGTLSGTMFLGPKETTVLKSLNIKADKIIDFGWFDIIAKPLIMLLNLLNKVIHNYGIGIIILTIIIKIIFYPLSIKSFKSMKEMQKLQPQIAKMKEKYKTDKAKLNQEMMELYRRHKVNPMGGCLPMVIQIPVFFALYKALSGAIELRHAPFMLWINDLSAPEDLFTFHVMGYAIPIRILPLVMGATQLIQQKMTPTSSADPMQEKLMLAMPIVFTFMFYGFSSGLVLYWLANNVISIAQQYYYNKKAA